MKILIITNNDVGFYKFKYELVQSFLESNHKIYILLPNGEFIPEFEKIGCAFYDIKMDRRGKNPFKDFILFSKYFAHMKTIKPDICVTYTIKPNIYGGFAARIQKIPTLVNITGLGSGIENEGLLKKMLFAMYKISIKKAKYVFFENEMNMEIFKKYHITKHNAVLLPGSGVNLKNYEFQKYPQNDEHIRFLFIGRIMKEKGINEFLECAETLKNIYPNISFDIIGSFEEKYKIILDQYVNQGIVSYLGFHKDVKRFIKNSHAIILPSYHEGLSNVLLESASMGRPIITSNIHGCKEVVDDQITGYLCKVADSSDLIEKVKKFILLSYVEKKTMGEKARKKVEQSFSRDIIIDKYKLAVESAIQGD